MDDLGYTPNVFAGGLKIIFFKRNMDMAGLSWAMTYKVIITGGLST